jgi:hypothetical protein
VEGEADSGPGAKGDVAMAATVTRPRRIVSVRLPEAKPHPKQKETTRLKPTETKRPIAHARRERAERADAQAGEDRAVARSRPTSRIDGC